MRFIVDASPALSWVAAGEQNALMMVATSYEANLLVCERVDREVVGKSNADRFRMTGVANTWTTLKQSGHVRILPDAVAPVGETPEDAAKDVGHDGANELPIGVSQADYALLLGQMLELVCLGMSAQARVAQGRDLGEDLSTAHALALASLGHHVLLLIDERRGRAEAKRAVARMLSQHSGTPGVVTVTNSSVILKACKPEWFSRQRTAADVWQRLCDFDDGLDRNHPDFRP